MKKFLMPSRFNIILLLCLSFLEMACSKSAGNTTSKLKIFSGNFTSILATKANNGLILYGKSSDGKFFTKKIENDTADLVFPNGTWSFYAIAWELQAANGALPDFKGKTYCGKTSAVLNGTDTTIAIDLTNAGCNDPAFSADTKFNPTPSPGIYELPSADFLTCKNLGAVSGSLNTYICDKTLTSNFNKGYATSYRVVAFESKNFGDLTPPVKIAQSMCAETNTTTSGGLSAPFEIRVPTTFGNGFSLAVEIFYGGSACDGSNGVDVIPFNDNPRLKTVVEKTYTPPKYFLHVKSDEADVCVPGPRMATTSFAAGAGTTGRPYAICTKEQLNLLRSEFLTYKASSFDLLTDIDYGMTKIEPIGDSLSISGGDPSHYYGNQLGYSTIDNPVFNGGNHKISHFMIDCMVPSQTAFNKAVGFFREVRNATLKNLVINQGIVNCEGGDNISVLVGKFQDETPAASTYPSVLENIKIHGHIEGQNNVGAAVGYASAVISANLQVHQVHAISDHKGLANVGGLFGTAENGTISKVSFSGSLGAGPHDDSLASSPVGGIIGKAVNLSLSEAIVKSERIEGSRFVGGLIGSASNVTLFDSYAEANLRSSSQTTAASPVYMGGAVGVADSGHIDRVLAFNGIRSSNRSATYDHTLGGIVGGFVTTAPVCQASGTNFFTGDNDSIGPTNGCGTQSPLASTKIQASFSNWSTNFNTKWIMPDEGHDTPRLAFEASIEMDVPYLKRDCHGYYASQYGAGTAADPKWICSYNQFLAMTPGFFYQLKKNIYYEGASFYPFTSGTYHLEGNNYGLYSFPLSNYQQIGSTTIYGQGIFASLDVGSTISHLKIFGSTLSASMISGTPILHAGLLAGRNAGTLENVSTSFGHANLNVAPTSAMSVYYGGLVGSNTGVIHNSTNDVDPNITGNFVNATITSNTLTAGGFVGFNSGQISGIKNHTSMSRTLSCNSNNAPMHFPYQEVLGAFVGKNTGSIAEVENQGEFRSNTNGAFSNCTLFQDVTSAISSFVAINNGDIHDFTSFDRINFYTPALGQSSNPQLFAKNTGSVARGFATFDTETDANRFALPNNKGTWNASGANYFTLSASCPTAGDYYTINGSSASSPFNSPVSNGDIVMCINGVNQIISAGDKNNYITPVSDVFYLTKQYEVSPVALSLGRYYETALTYSLPYGSNFGVSFGGIPIPLSTSWSVGSDPLNATNAIWNFEVDPQTGVTNKNPDLHSTSGKLSDLGEGFP